MPSFQSHFVKFFMQRTMRKSQSLPLKEQRVRMAKNAQRFQVAEGVSCHSVQLGASRADFLLPKLSAISDAAVLYLHGGAYTAGSLDTHRALVSHIVSASGVPALVIDYRLAPECPFPAALEDAEEGFDWIQNTLKIRPDRIIFVGDSAGGGLAVATALRLRDQGHAVPGALVCLSPWLDLSLSGESVKALQGQDPFFHSTERLRESAIAYAGNYSLAEPCVSPLFASLKGLPRIHIQVGADEILLSDSLALAELAKNAGVKVDIDVWPGMWHVWQLFCDWIPESRLAVRQLGEVIGDCLTSPVPD